MFCHYCRALSVNKKDGQLLSDTAPRPRAGCGSRVLPQKRLLEEEYAICYPTTNKRSRELIPCQSSSTFVNTQEVDDFKLAVELQYEENMTCSEGNNFRNSTDCGVSGDHMDETNNAAVDGTNNAAAALISLNNIGGTLLKHPGGKILVERDLTTKGLKKSN